MTEISYIDLNIVSEILLDLATELDFHYENEELIAIISSLAKMRKGMDLLQKNNQLVPEACLHLLKRYEDAVGLPAQMN